MKRAEKLPLKDVLSMEIQKKKYKYFIKVILTLLGIWYHYIALLLIKIAMVVSKRGCALFSQQKKANFAFGGTSEVLFLGMGVALTLPQSLSICRLYSTFVIVCTENNISLITQIARFTKHNYP